MHNPTLRVTEVLDLICKNRESLRLAQISDALKIPKSTLLPILQTLCEKQYISRDAYGRYGPGFSLMLLGSAAKEANSPWNHIRKHLEQLVECFQETCYYGVPEGGNVLYMEKVDSPQPLRMLTTIGHRLPAYATGIGKALLLDKTEAQLKELYGEKTEPLTKQTITETETLYRQLQQAKILGYTWEVEESTEHIRCFAVPVRKNNEIIGAVSIAIPVFRYKESEKKAITEALKQTAQKIEQGLQLLL